MEWKTIDSAPKDGQWIRLWRTPSDVSWMFTQPEVIAKWSDEEMSWVWPDDDYQVFTEFGMRRADELIEKGCFYLDNEFTHWMPMPSAPSN